MSTPRSDELLYAAGGDVWEKYGTFVKRTLPEEERGAFSRSSDATYTDRSGNLRTAESGILRPHYVSSESSYSARLEAARTNEIGDSEAFDQWSTNGTCTVTPNTAVAPDGTVSGDEVKSSGNSYDAVQKVPGFGDSEQAVFSFYFLPSPSTSSLVRMQVQNTTDAETIGFMQFNPQDQTIDSTNTQQGSLDRWDIVEGPADWYRAWMVVTLPTDASSDTIKWQIMPDRNSNGEMVVAWGAQIEKGAFPSSYIATQGSAVSRAADDLSFPISFSAQRTYTTYVKARIHNSVDTPAGEGGIIGVGGAGGLILYREPSGWRVYYEPDQGCCGVGVDDTTSGFSVGDIVEFRIPFDPGATLPGYGMTVGGGSEILAPDTTWPSNPSDFPKQEVVIGNARDGRGFLDVISGPIIAPGVRTMDECREIEV